MHAANSNPFRDIFEQFADEASFLWLLRSMVVTQPHYNAVDLAELEQRIENHLSGLKNDPVIAWEICAEALELEEPGEVFTAAVVAFRNREIEPIQIVVESAFANDETINALVSALAWIDPKLSMPWIEKFLRSKDFRHKYLALATLGVLRKDPGDYLINLLKRDDCMADERLYARCMRLIGEIKRHDLIPALNAVSDSENETIAFWARWSLILLGNHTLVKQIETQVISLGPLQKYALPIFFRAAPPDYCRSVISQLAQQEDSTRLIIQASAALGDPQVIPWLISKMDDLEFARAAGEAFTHITGIDLEANDLSIDIPEIPQMPSDDVDDEFVGLDEDEHLPWPDVARLKVLWQKYGSKFRVGQRYFMGQEPNINSLKQYLLNSGQRTRFAAALELALMDRNLPLYNVKGKVNR